MRKVREARASSSTKILTGQVERFQEVVVLEQTRDGGENSRSGRRAEPEEKSSTRDEEVSTSEESQLSSL